MKPKIMVFTLVLLLAWIAYVNVSADNSIALGASSQFSKNKVFYFHNITKSILGQKQYIMNTLLPVGETPIEVIFNDAEKSFSWFIDPPLAGDVLLNGTLSLNIWLKLVSGAGEGTLYITLRLGLYEVFENGTRIRIVNEGDAANQAKLGPITSHFSEYSVKGYIQTTYKVTAGSRLEVFLSVSSNDRARKHVVWGSSNFRSRVCLPAISHISVDRVDAYNATGEQPSHFEVNDTITFKATILDPFGGYDIRWVNLTLEAPDGSHLFEKAAMIKTIGDYASLVSIYELLWEATPKMRGTYTVTVEAVDNTGYYYRFPDRPGDETFGGHLESLTMILSIGKVIYANFLIKDSLEQPLAEATLEIWDSTTLVARVTTNETGHAKVANIPGAGNYTARVWWQDVKVFDQIINIVDVMPEESPLILKAAVYYPTFQIVDDANVPLSDASVFLSHPNGNAWMLPFKTNSEGQFGLTQTASGTYILRIIWSGVEVGVKSIDVSSNEVYTVKADVFYLTIETKDLNDNPVESVHVIITDVARALVVDSKLSNTSGIVISRLPKATYDLKATWLGATVATLEEVTLNQNLTLALNLTIFNVQIKVVDQRQLPLESAIVEATFEGFKVIDNSNNQGSLTLKLPGGTLHLKVWWKDVLVFSGTHTVGEITTNIIVTTQVYYVTIKTVDKDGNPLPGVYLTLQKDGAPINGGFTNLNGVHEFREPLGEYTVIADLRTTYYLTDIIQTSTKTFHVPTETVVVHFPNYPPPYQNTILFSMLLIIAISLGAITTLTLFIFKFKLK